MRRFAVLVLALVLAPGLQSATVRNDLDLINLPGIPGPVLTPEIIPEAQPVIPELIEVNPCNACFEYMSSLIDQLTQVPAPEQESEVPVRPLPETSPEDLRPLPLPVAPEVEINPIPIPVQPELRPLPVPVAPEVGANPVPLPVAPQVRLY